MGRFILSFVSVLLCFTVNAQLTMVPEGGSYRASVSQQLGLTQVTIDYGRPCVKGREGHIWGELVPEGFNLLGYGNGKPCPWRAGANENTTIEFSTAVIIEGKPLAAGRYGFFIAYGHDECTLIFSHNATSWGSFFYEESEDALRVKVKPRSISGSMETLTYLFSAADDSSATVSLLWEKLEIPFRVSTALQQLQLASIHNELRSEKGFTAPAYLQAAEYMNLNNVALEEALLYATIAETGPKNFRVYLTKAAILEKLHRKLQADSAMNMAIETATAAQLHNYARSLLAEKMTAKAMEMFKANYKKNGSNFTTNVGMARGLSAAGDYKEALKYANKALPLAPDAANKASIETIIAMLKEGKDVNG
ncbi:MAG: hypothetical protein BGO69_09930 [Bacteroidetes bacterium 46-16]|nr:MAG: hypothetical protein BGO69_09930 [Bacteroidetes bacterium 46-16]